MNNIDAKFDKKTGKIIVTGTLNEERDPREIKDQLPKFEAQVKDLEEQVIEQKKQIENLGATLLDDEMTKFIELSKRVQAYNKTLQLQSDTATKENKLTSMKTELAKQKELIKEFDEWSK